MIRLIKMYKGVIQMKNNKGITLIALTITIIVLIIIASVGTYSGVQSLRESKENSQIAEVGMIQQAVLESYIKFKTTGNSMYIRGQEVTYTEMEKLINEINSKISGENTISLKAYNYDRDNYYGFSSHYYELSNEDLAEMGILQVDGNTFIVNYVTGEVINKVLQVTRSGKPLYTYAEIQEIPL